ncbi:MAG: GGDEF domain-containing protein [Marinisporobacter sp.]|jgi:diguanylate cyclase (GGDEF)-like protein|nr:GGDEF domain-containing protein [Marinisporobacter sp.]
MEDVKAKNKISLKIILYIATIVFIIFMVVYGVMMEQIEKYQEEEMNNFATIIRKSMNNIYLTDKRLENSTDEKLHLICKSMYSKIKEKSIGQLDDILLQQLKNDYGLYGISILVKKNEDIRIVKSTEVKEVGMSTKEWGYWNDALLEMFEGKQVSIQKGYGKDAFWVGPRTLSYVSDGFFKYAYYYNEKNDYIINPFILENEVNKLTYGKDLDEILLEIKNTVSFIDEIAVIDGAAWLHYKSKSYKYGADPVVLYGDMRNTAFLYTNKKVEDIVFSQDKIYEELTYSNKKYAITYIPIGDKKIVVMMLNEEDKIKLRNKTMYLFVLMGIISIISIYVVANFMIKNYNKLLQIKKERLKVAEEFKNTMSMLPDLIYRCRMDKNGYLYVTYNEGKLVEENEFLNLKGKDKRIEEVYTKEMLNDVKEHLEGAFKQERARFEVKIGNRIFENVVTPIYDSGIDEETGMVKEIMGIATDVTERIQAEKKAKYMAYHDTLTGLPNRALLQEYLDEMIGCKDQGKIAVYFMDLDGFKLVNDTSGHKVGDALLKSLGQRVEESLKNGLFARIGGDEFAYVYKIHSNDEIKEIATKLIGMINKPFVVDTNSYEIGVSIGISVYPDHGNNRKTILHKADIAMYEVKKEEKNNFKIYNNY